ncbi:autoinducer-2 kinase [Motiliproteus sp. MSK22-1]|uniref:autoinducer-2 kinase n=1 Tax=Motiliproteus sp. MSK22-1 TaxID=1897630 RepID=UPI000978C6AC|nr:autoinducer-2 kinase [Motiliproteus sp. MSK22-1]OMH27991.1 autoinducer-2 kinase [Motiliproteus sp. MSK22-1]
MDRYLMTIDAGTGSGRALLFDLQGNEIAIGQQEWSHLAEKGVPNSMGFDCSANWDLLCRCIKKVLAEARIKAEQVVAVTATSMREGIVLYDRDGKELWAVANVDARADQQVRNLKQKFPGIEEQFYQRSGQTFALGALPRLLWVKENEPDCYQRADKVSMISDWVLARLSGTIAADPSNGGTTGIFSLAERQWQPEMAQQVGLNAKLFPPVFESGQVIGEVTPTAAADCGLKTGTPVVMGGGDVQLGSAGLGIVKQGQSAVLGGTFWQQVVNIDATTAPPQDMRIRVNPHVIDGLSQAEGITFFSGLTMRWFRDAFCGEEVKLAQQRGIDPYLVLEEMAEQVPVGSHGIVPIFSDAMKYGRWYHASPSFLNLSIDASVCNKASMFRSLQENACIVSAINLQAISDFSGYDSDSIVFAGGASKGFLWPQILADVTGKNVCIPKIREATALGGAMTAAVGIGLYGSISEVAEQWVAWDKQYQPNLANYQKYSEVKERWLDLYQRQLRLVDEGLTTSMWKAPGL